LGFLSSQVGSGRLSSHLVSGHFGFRIVSSQVGLVIGSFSVGLFQILNHIGLDWIRSNQISQFVSDLVKSNESDQIEFLSNVYLSHVGFTLISIELNFFVFYLLNPQFIVIYTIHVLFEKYVELLIEKYLIDIIVNIIININFII
jgi:hypothetical protein